MAAPILRPTPGPTVGHHFLALQACIHRAWSDYHVPAELKADPPGFLAALQRDGTAHEERICAQLYPTAVRIPERLPAAERSRRTIEAMRSGAPAILQAFLVADGKVGVADVLEHYVASTSSSTGNIYRVGEFKRANTLAIAHVLQAAWYAELLGTIQNAAPPEVFFVLGDGTRQSIPLADTETVFAAQKATLQKLRDPAARPGPHLCRACVSCPWRSVCIPELIATEHVSLLPTISRRTAERLKATAGITSWTQLAMATDQQLRDYGIPEQEWEPIRTAIAQLQSGGAVTRFALNGPRLSALTAVSVEFATTHNEPEKDHPPPAAIWVEGTGSAAATRIAIDQNWQADLTPLVGREPFAAYGVTESAVTRRLLQEGRLGDPGIVDLLSLIENFVHAPLAGLELGQVLTFANPSLLMPDNARSRLRAVRTVLDWMASTGTAA